MSTSRFFNANGVATVQKSVIETPLSLNAVTTLLVAAQTDVYIAAV